ncbi:response regulator [Solilutibacter silvestris]|uniref:Response regulator receiver domain n=1 Tax=Solilutibacter silvestris TaxID=1645665 RepID=A0A2K1Q3W6_9GAMM|nr:response regulator [Lysobacter silvestris]PNS09637.1 Response regulator receiver domain [Lysobacter silvestris]
MGWIDFLRWPATAKVPVEPTAAPVIVPLTDGYAGEERRRRPRRNPSADTRLLIVDDSGTVLSVLGRMLKQTGVQVATAASGEDAMASIGTQRPDAILLDIVMPGMDGFSVLRALRRDAETRDIPVIMMSGNEQATEQYYAQRIGADAFLRKPFGRSDVFSHLERLLDWQGRPMRPHGGHTTQLVT